MLHFAYERLKATQEKADYSVLQKNTSKEDDIFLNRKLDCAIINLIIKDALRQCFPFDSVRGVFWEGEEAYPSAGFKQGNHIQVSIITTDCIKGFFLPRILKN